MKTYLLILVLAITNLTFAQEKPQPNPTKIQLSVGGNYTAGNAEILGFTTNNILSHTTLRREWTISPSFIYTQVQQGGEFVPKQRELYVTGSVQERRSADKFLSSFEVESSLVKQIRLRSSIGLGWSFDIFRNDKTKLVISEAAVYESYLSDIIINKNLQSVRASTRIRFVHSGKVNTDIVALIQPAIWDDRNLNVGDNTNMRVVTTFAIPVNKRLQFGITSTLIGSTYSNYVNPLVKSFDVINSFTITYKNQ